MRKDALYGLMALLFGALMFFVGRGSDRATTEPTTYQDTMRFLIQDLKKDIAQLKEERAAIAMDTIRINSKYDALLARINSNRSDSAQLAILKQLLNKPDPEPIDINTEIAKGQQCCDLLDNSREQLKLCDSASSLKDSINTLHEKDVATLHDLIAERDQKITDQGKTLEKTKKHLKGWRKVAIVEGIAMITAGTIYYLTHK
jgi:hypothetical protein